MSIFKKACYMLLSWFWYPEHSSIMKMLEGLAFFRMCGKWHACLYGRGFTLRMDHQALMTHLATKGSGHWPQCLPHWANQLVKWKLLSPLPKHGIRQKSTCPFSLLQHKHKGVLKKQIFSMFTESVMEICHLWHFARQYVCSVLGNVLRQHFCLFH